ncbi:hypothetical protein PybrP1_008125 [[Pythium] brassicae (nom. inval.)]|nr:hypothetical protein PybrP1_008125 [[Pythium] brassicae (nom. inval.)]
MATSVTASAVPAPTPSLGVDLRSSSAKTLFESMNPLGLLKDAAQMTPSEFLRDFYTRRGLPDKLKDVDALVAAYSHQMPQLYAELDNKYGTSLLSNPPPIREETRPAATTTQYVTPATPPAPPRPHSHKIVLLGNSGVGKTNLLSRLNKGEFSSEFTSTIGVEFLTHRMLLDGAEVKAQIWDTAGQERFHAMMSTYYRKAVGALLIFDVRDRQSLLGVDKWLDQLLSVAEPGLHAVLVGNKCDLLPPERAVSPDEAQHFAAARHMQYVETSAKTGQNVEEAFHSVIAAVHRAHVAELAAQERAPAATLDLTAGGHHGATGSFLDTCQFA